MTPDEGEEGGIWKWNWNCRDRCRSYVPDLFDRRLHNLVLVPAQLKHDGGSSSPDSADAAESMSFGQLSPMGGSAADWQMRVAARRSARSFVCGAADPRD